MEKHLADVPAGSKLTVLATDPMAKIDIPLFCRQNGHAVTIQESDGTMRFNIIKGKKP